MAGSREVSMKWTNSAEIAPNPGAREDSLCLSLVSLKSESADAPGRIIMQDRFLAGFSRSALLYCICPIGVSAQPVNLPVCSAMP